jgi:hypothetical protein
MITNLVIEDEDLIYEEVYNWLINITEKVLEILKR